MSNTYCPRTGKVGYTRHGASATILAMFGKKRKNDDRLYPYRCRFCGAWHVGRTDPTSWRRRVERDKRGAG